MNEQGKKCLKCGGNVSGFKCDMCGAEAAEHDEKHSCGGDHCVAKCASCDQAETKCSCKSEGKVCKMCGHEHKADGSCDCGCK